MKEIKIPNIYKGFLPSDGKKPLESIKDGNYLSEPPVNGDYVGVLKDNVTMVDIDTLEESEIMLKIIEGEKLNCHVLETANGSHIYFQNTNPDQMTNRVKWKTPIGLTIDVKHGGKNTVDPLKISGGVREWLKISNILDEYPFWIYPMKHAKNLSESTTRNNDLFTYVLPLQGEGFTKDQIRTILTIINKYILQKPLSAQELETIMRDEAFSKPTFFIKNKLQHEKFADYLIREHNIITLDGQIHLFNESKYIRDENQIYRLMSEYAKNLTINQRREVSAVIRFLAPQKTESPAQYINLKNGVLDIETLQLIPHDPNYIFKSIIDFDYYPNTTDPGIIDEVFKNISCGDLEIKSLLEEIVGYCLHRDYTDGYIFFLTNESGSNGKSTYLNMIKTLLGTDNITSFAVNEISYRFNKIMLYGKMANLGFDAGTTHIQDSGFLKNASSGKDLIMAEEKGKQPFQFKNYAKLIFACNTMPTCEDKTGAFIRRLKPIPFNGRFKKLKEREQVEFFEMLNSKQASEYLLKLGVDGLRRVLNDGFTGCEAVEDRKLEYETENNSILQFLSEIPKNQIENNSCAEAYLAYQVWCAENGIKQNNIETNIKFGKVVKSKLNLVSKQVKVNGKNIKYYKPIEVTK